MAFKKTDKRDYGRNQIHSSATKFKTPSNKSDVSASFRRTAIFWIAGSIIVPIFAGGAFAFAVTIFVGA